MVADIRMKMMDKEVAREKADEEFEVRQKAVILGRGFPCTLPHLCSV